MWRAGAVLQRRWGRGGGVRAGSDLRRHPGGVPGGPPLRHRRVAASGGGQPSPGLVAPHVRPRPSPFPPPGTPPGLPPPGNPRGLPPPGTPPGAPSSRYPPACRFLLKTLPSLLQVLVVLLLRSPSRLVFWRDILLEAFQFPASSLHIPNARWLDCMQELTYQHRGSHCQQFRYRQHQASGGTIENEG